MKWLFLLGSLWTLIAFVLTHEPGYLAVQVGYMIWSDVIDLKKDLT